MKVILHGDGYFSIKVTPLGDNLFLLEDLEEGEMEALLEERCDWLKHWFKEVKRWRKSDVDPERVTWLRCYSIPYHIWNPRFFEFVTATLGHYICGDDNTSRRSKMDVARLMIQTRCVVLINEVINVEVDGVLFRIKMIEEV